MDFAGPFLGSMFLIIVDSYSKWPIVKQMRKTTSSQTIEVLRTVFSDWGLPTQIVSDNGPQFISEEFKTFLRENSIQQILSAPYHPKTNGLAERLVQTFKLAMKAAKNDQGTIQTKLAKFLIVYSNTPHSTTKECPSTLILGRKLSTRLDLIKPNLSDAVSKSQQNMVRSTRDRQYELGKSVSVKDYRADTDKWIPGVIHRKTGPVSYQVEIAPQVYWRRHTGQIQNACWSQPGEAKYDLPVSGGTFDIPDPPPLIVEHELPDSSSVVNTPATTPPKTPQKTPAKTPAPPVAERPYPIRARKKPVKLDL